MTPEQLALRQRIRDAKLQYAAAGNSMIHGSRAAVDHMEILREHQQKLIRQFLKAGGKLGDLP